MPVGFVHTRKVDCAIPSCGGCPTRLMTFLTDYTLLSCVLYSVTGGQSSYGNNLQCKWRAVASPPSRVVASFSAISTQTQRTTLCVFDYISISEAVDNTTTILLCGTLPQVQFAASSSTLDVSFASDRNVRLRGFNVTFTIVPACAMPGSAAAATPAGWLPHPPLLHYNVMAVPCLGQ